MKGISSIVLVSILLFASCTEDDSSLVVLDEEQQSGELTDKSLIIKFGFDSEQERLDNFGKLSTIPPSNAAQSPAFNSLSAHFVELVPNEFTPYGVGALVYKGEEVPANNSNEYGFTTAIDFNQAVLASDGEMFLEVPLTAIDTGTYQHIRVSVSYQNYAVLFNLNNLPIINSLPQQAGTLASFIGYNNYINSVEVGDMELTVNDSKLQGFWGFETHLPSPYSAYDRITTGQAPANATTVVNPFPNSPIPPGSCVVSGSFDAPLTINWKEQEDLIVILSFSINNSFEWEDLNGNAEWDIDATNPELSEKVVDMGLRGLKAFSE